MSQEPDPPRKPENTAVLRARLTDVSQRQMEEFREAHETQVLTILLSDLISSTRQQSELGNVRAAELVKEHRRVFRAALEKVEGREIETAGDSFLAVFAAPSEGVKFALRLQAAMRAARRAHPELPEVRVGIHQGQVVVERHESGPKSLDIYGLQVSVAARIADLAAGGQSLCSRAVFDDARAILRDEDLAGLGPVSWCNHGSYRFKGVEDFYDVCEVGEEGLAPMTAPAAGAKGWPADLSEEELGWRPAVGVTVPGTNWQLIERLGREHRPGERAVFRGEFGEVWKAFNSGDKSYQVFKFCFRRDRVPILKREARLLKRLRQYRHPSLLEVYDVTEADRPPYYLEMEYAEGPTLEEWLAGDPPLEERTEVVAQVADALDTVHAAGIYHRDIKPSNLLLTRREDGALQAKLADFGLGAAEDETLLKSLYTSRMAGVAGTWDYIAPELRRGEPASAQSDIYSLGLTLFQVVTGDLQALAGPGWEARVSSEVLRADIAGCMDSDPEKRPQRAAELAVALRSLGAREERLRLQREREERRQRARRLRKTAGVVTLLTIALAAAVYWWRMPGTLELEVKPPGARIEVADRTIISEAWPIPVRLRPGTHQVRMSLPDHYPETREITVGRGDYRQLDVRLRHHRGVINVICEPPGAEIMLNDVIYGSRITDLPYDTGRHRLVVRRIGYFQAERRIELRKDERFTERFWLDRGPIWMHTSPAVQGAAFLVGDVDGDGAPDLAQNELSSVVIHSTASGRVLARLPAPRNYSRFFGPLELGGEVGRVLANGLEDSAEGGGPGGLEVRFIRASSPTRYLWRWRGPERNWKTFTGITMRAVGDLNGDGVAEVAVSSRDGKIYVLDVGHRRKHAEVVATKDPLKYPAYFQLLGGGGAARVLYAANTGPGSDPGSWTYRVGCVGLTDGKARWGKDLGQVRGVAIRDVDGDGVVDIFAWTRRGWTVLEGSSGKVRWDVKLPPGRRMPPAPLMTDLDGDGTLEVLLADPGEKSGLLAVRMRDGGKLWEGPAGARTGQPLTREGLLTRGPRGEVLVFLKDALVALKPDTGEEAWRVTGAPLGLLVGDWEGDGKDEIFVTFQGRGLTCLDGSGKRRWTLRLNLDVRPYALMPDVDGDGLNEILIHRHAALFGLVRGPRVLWSRAATAPLQARPLVVKTPRGPRVLVPGAWGADRHLLCLNAAGGAELWSSKLRRPYNRAPAVADFDGDGRLDLALIGRRAGEQHDRLEVYRLEDGKLVRSVPVKEYGSVYCTPAVADFDGDGTPDLAVNRWDGKDVAAFSGKSGALLWRRKTGTGNFGGVAAADLDGDGRPDVVAPSMNGKLYAIRGRDGKDLWPPLPLATGGSRAEPLLEDMNGDKVPDVLVVTVDGVLHVVDGRSGKSIWKATVKGASEGLGRPAVARVGKRTLVLAPLGRAGVVAFDFAARKEVWRSPRGYPVLAGPTVADLDGDGRQEVVVGTVTGRLLVLDLDSGKLLWTVRVGRKLIEAAPAVCDVDGDGILDILVATHDFKLTAISGLGTVGARRRLERRATRK